jgi:hypothetical protein
MTAKFRKICSEVAGFGTAPSARQAFSGDAGVRLRGYANAPKLDQRKNRCLSEKAL